MYCVNFTFPCISFRYHNAFIEWNIFFLREGMIRWSHRSVNVRIKSGNTYRSCSLTVSLSWTVSDFSFPWFTFGSDCVCLKSGFSWLRSPISTMLIDMLFGTFRTTSGFNSVDCCPGSRLGQGVVSIRKRFSRNGQREQEWTMDWITNNRFTPHMDRLGE